MLRLIRLAPVVAALATAACSTIGVSTLGAQGIHDEWRRYGVSTWVDPSAAPNDNDRCRGFP